MTSRERIGRMFEHKEADRVPLHEIPWDATLARWRTEGLGENDDYVDFFDIDKIRTYKLDNSPRYPKEILEETDEFRVETTSWGSTFKYFTDKAGVPGVIDNKIKTPDEWPDAKAA